MNAHSFTGYTKIEIQIKERSFWAGSGNSEKDGGEDRTRTCKRFRAVVFKTTALPIRLPLRMRSGESNIPMDAAGKQKR